MDMQIIYDNWSFKYHRQHEHGHTFGLKGD